MSAIAGLLRRDGGPAHQHDLDLMLAALAHRGRQATSWRRGPVALGHRLLRTLPARLAGAQPAVSGALVLTADARIDNRSDLAAELRCPGAADPELILAAYRRWGRDCPRHLVGDFAFAIWDGGRRSLFCARDHAGVRLLHFWPSPERFAFATEIGGLLTLEGVPKRLDEERLAELAVDLVDDTASTLYLGILSLRPAHWLEVTADRIEISRYWTLEDCPDVRLRDDRAYAVAFRECLAEAVRCRLTAPGRPGIALSGGLDSSSIACLARSSPGGALPAYSARYREPAADESEFIRAVLGGGGLDPRPVEPERLDPLIGLGALGRVEDEPSWDFQVRQRWAILERAAREDVNVVLDGFGGDDAVSSGLAGVTEMLRAGRILSLVREARLLRSRLGYPATALARYRLLSPLMPVGLYGAWCLVRDTAWRRPAPMLRDDFARRTRITERLADLSRCGRAATSARDEQLRGLQAGAHAFDLDVFDRVSAAFGIEPRYPFYDRRLLELSVGMPAEQKLRDGWPRYALRAAMAGVLPESVRWRTGKGDPSAAFTRDLGELSRGLLYHYLVHEVAMIEPYLDLRRLRATLERFESHPTLEAAHTLWKSAKLAAWLEQAGVSS